MTANSEEEHISLVVLSHGLWGVKSHMEYIENQLQKKYKDKLEILNSSVNEAKYSYDGIDICGIRLVNEIESMIVRLGKNGKKVKKISFVGYSLGGLITRYAIGILGERGVFDTIEPQSFVTFATPHMGVRLPSSSLLSFMFNLISGKLVSRSGEQLQLVDNYKQHKPLLEIMSDPNEIYFKYLGMFKTRRAYANIANDRTVPYWTAGMELMDYFYKSKGKLDLTLDEKYVSIITAFDVRHPSKTTSYKQDKAFKKKERKPFRTVAIKYTLYCLFPIVAPLFVLIALSVLSVQGLISRHRVAHLLSTTQSSLILTLDNNKRRNSTRTDQLVHGEMMAGALDAVNLIPPGEENDDRRNDTSQQQTISYKVQPSPELFQKSSLLKLDDTTRRIHANLQLLVWERIWLYLKAFNAHGSIVCRQKRFATDGGVATVQHFVDSTQLI